MQNVGQQYTKCLDEVVCYVITTIHHDYMVLHAALLLSGRSVLGMKRAEFVYFTYIVYWYISNTADLFYFY